MSIFLPIQSHIARPFVTKKQWSFSNSANGGVTVLLCTDLTGSFSTNISPTSSGLYTELLYESIQAMYYLTSSMDYYTFGKYSDQIYRKLHSQCIVVNVAQNKYGERIVPKTFKFEDTGKSRTLYDDGYGNLYDFADSASFAVSASTYTVGNIFYEHGVAVITNTGSNYIDFGLSNWILTYRGKHVIYENEVTCTINAGELNYTLNPTIRLDSNGNYTEYVTGFVTGSYWTPYMTKIGLYNSDGEMLAVIQFPKPVRVDSYMATTVVARFDT